MIHIFIFFLWNLFYLSSKPKANAEKKQKQQECNDDNNQRLIRAVVDAIGIHATQTEPYLR